MFNYIDIPYVSKIMKLLEYHKSSAKLADYLEVSRGSIVNWKEDDSKINDDNRLKIIGNKLYNEDGKQKQRSLQLYRLSKEDRNLLNVSSLGDKLTDVMELCYYIEQLKLVKKIDDIQLKINNIPTYVISHQKELNKFFQRKKR